MLLILASDKFCEIDFQFMFMKAKSYGIFYLFVSIKILVLNTTPSYCFGILLFLHLGFILGIFF
jgi:hypothetical protein